MQKTSFEETQMVKPDYIIRSHRKTLCISINKVGDLIVRAPRQLSIDAINKFLIEKESWIKLKKEQVRLKHNQNKSVLNYEKLLYLGKEYSRIDVAKMKTIEWDIPSKKVFVPQEWDNIDFVKRLSTEYIKKSKEILLERVPYFAKLMSLNYHSISINNNKSRWGCCSRRGDLKFNFRLAMLKPDTIDYIIIHELAHLIEFNHSKTFYKVIEAIMPKYKSQVSELKNKSFLLELCR